MSNRLGNPEAVSAPEAGSVRKHWSKPQIITASVAGKTAVTFKLTPSLTDYTDTGTSHIGS